ncbi:MAG: DUF255 domain-containing protein, partial [Bacteroidota bacterium]|nr:DUF255 domain-containing protein [Bacteroidota bacterium]MDX5430388.1 DUF255 domain-containing protein [Bacteroidota bacterium]MDX5469149.1 DUF255 domain-containing protein [Bacteroidota bacterium]
MKRYLLALLSVLSLSFAFAQTNFIKNQDWEAIKEQAKRENKLIFLDAYTDWCGWCKVMDKKTFSDETIGKMMNQYFVNVKLEMEKEELGIKLALKYSVTSFPSYLVFNAEGEMIYQTIGYQEQAVFMTTLMDIINPAKHHSRPGYGKSLDLEYPKFYLKAMGQNGKRKFPEEKEVNEWMDKNSDLSKEVNWTVYQRFIYAANEKNANRFWDNKAELDSLYGKDLVDNVAKNLLGTQMRTMAKDGDDSKMENTLKKRLPLIDKG